jgi:hypothetical protein
MTVAPLSGARAIWQILGATSIEICHFGGSLIDKPAGILNESAVEKQKASHISLRRETLVSSRFLYFLM